MAGQGESLATTKTFRGLGRPGPWLRGRRPGNLPEQCRQAGHQWSASTQVLQVSRILEVLQGLWSYECLPSSELQRNGASYWTQGFQRPPVPSVLSQGYILRHSRRNATDLNSPEKCTQTRGTCETSDLVHRPWPESIARHGAMLPFRSPTSFALAPFPFKDPMCGVGSTGTQEFSPWDSLWFFL